MSRIDPPADPDMRCGICGRRCYTRTALNRHEADCERKEQERRDAILADRLSEEIDR